MGGLTLTQCSMLFTLRMYGPMRLGEISAIEKVTAPTTTQAVTRLESLGLVTRTRDDSDQRVMRIAITPAGEAMHRSALDELLQIISSELTATEVATLSEALTPLERLTRALDSRTGS